MTTIDFEERRNKKLKHILIIVVMISQILCFGMGYYLGREASDGWSFECDKEFCSTDFVIPKNNVSMEINTSHDKIVIGYT